MLITLDQAKIHLEIEHDEFDDKIEEKIVEASSIVLDYIEADENAWQTTDGAPHDVPGVIQAAAKLVLGALMENREGNEKDPQPLSQAVKDLLHRYRTPAIA